jgi:hypothetical protein
MPKQQLTAPPSTKVISEGSRAEMRVDGGICQMLRAMWGARSKVSEPEDDPSPSEGEGREGQSGYYI